MKRRKEQELNDAVKLSNIIFDKICKNYVSKIDINLLDFENVKKQNEDDLKIIAIHYNVDNCLRVLNNPKLFENLNKL